MRSDRSQDTQDLKMSRRSMEPRIASACALASPKSRSCVIWRSAGNAMRLWASASAASLSTDPFSFRQRGHVATPLRTLRGSNFRWPTVTPRIGWRPKWVRRRRLRCCSVAMSRSAWMRPRTVLRRSNSLSTRRPITGDPLSAMVSMSSTRQGRAWRRSSRRGTILNQALTAPLDLGLRRARLRSLPSPAEVFRRAPLGARTSKEPWPRSSSRWSASPRLRADVASRRIHFVPTSSTKCTKRRTKKTLLPRKRQSAQPPSKKIALLRRTFRARASPRSLRRNLLHPMIPLRSDRRWQVGEPLGPSRAQSFVQLAKEKFG